ncbi:glycosyltransferase [Vibrio campbellii]|uniref:glycosyltransferase n=1 Tax=Vibrio campbellii TaxID=680 RepID=UPI0005F083A2|nr:glycosyltransferase [Vibrio campbellii]
MSVLKSGQRVLLVSYCFSSDNLAESERAYYLAKTLIEQGINVDVLTKKNQSNLLLEDKIDLKCYLPETSLIKNKFLNRLLNPLPDGMFWTFFKSRKYSNLTGYDYIISTSPPHSLHVVSYYISKSTNTRLIIDLRDAWRENRLVNYGTVIHRIISNYIYSRCLKQAYLIMANTKELKIKILEHIPDLNIITVPNGYPRDSFDNLRPIEILSGQDKKFLYSGGTYGGKAVEVISSLVLANHIEDLRVGYLGENIEESSSSEWLGRVVSDDVPSYLMSVDCLILYMPKRELDSARVLLKSYGYAKSGKPVLYIGPENATYNFLKKHTYVLRIDEDDVSGFKKAIERIGNKNITTRVNKKDFSFEYNFQKHLISRN